MNILGIHSSYNLDNHDPSAALVCDGTLKVVCEEERFSRHKMGMGELPIQSIRNCLKTENLKIEDIDLIITDGETWPELIIRSRQMLKHYFGFSPPIELINHHTAHLASAYYCSNFDEAMCLSLDAYGDKVSSAFAVGRGLELEILEQKDESQSLGFFYAVMTSYLGFLPGIDEYKVMGLAPYGNPGIDLSSLVNIFENDIEVKTDSFKREMNHLVHWEPYFSTKLEKKYGPARIPGSPIGQMHRDFAYATQDTLERAVCAYVTGLHKKTGLRKICLAGGIALNCSANLKIAQLPFIDEIFVQPAASDRGLCVGSALYAAVQNGENVKSLENVYKGPSDYNSELKKTLEQVGARFSKPKNRDIKVAELLAQNKVVALFQGRSEFGPRALGHRSILANPGEEDMKDIVNAKIKYREDFRPFAPSVLAESANELFEMNCEAPYMTITYPVKEKWRGRIPAVTHINNTARVQTVSKNQAPEFYGIIDSFYNEMGIPAVLNTSFNVKGQPIVETPLDAIGTFASTGIDAMAIGPFIVEK